MFVAGRAGYPIDDDVPGRPEVLLAEGDAPVGARRGRGSRSWVHARQRRTGSPTRDELGAALGEAGVTVVSGLAIGIDGAAHQGALEAGGGVIGVVATGLDVVYPRRHAALFGARPAMRDCS